MQLTFLDTLPEADLRATLETIVKTQKVNVLRPICQNIRIEGAWKASKNKLVNDVTNYFVDCLLNIHGEIEQQDTMQTLVEWAGEIPSFIEIVKVETAAVEEPDMTLALPAVQEEQIPDVEASHEPTQTPIEVEVVEATAPVKEPSATTEEPPAKPKAKSKSKAPKKPKTYTLSSLIANEEIEKIQSAGRLTAATCSDPNRLVVKRDFLAEMLNERLGVNITPKQFNQLVVMATNKLPRQPMTIKSASRFKYLLLEGDSALWVYDWILNNTAQIDIAANMAEIAAEEGFRVKMGQ